MITCRAAARVSAAGGEKAEPIRVPLANSERATAAMPFGPRPAIQVAAPPPAAAADAAVLAAATGGTPPAAAATPSVVSIAAELTGSETAELRSPQPRQYRWSETSAEPQPRQMLAESIEFPDEEFTPVPFATG